MATITRPDDGRRRVREQLPDPFAGPPVMSNQLANALTTGAPLTIRQLEFCMEHYKELANTLQTSGPHFATARTVAIQMANVAITRLNDVNAREAERRMQERAGYQPIREIER